MASRIATLGLHLLAAGVAGRRSEGEGGFPTSALKAVGVAMGAGGPYADPGVARPRALHLDHHVPGQMHEDGSSDPWKPDSDAMAILYERHRANQPNATTAELEESGRRSFKGHAFARTKDVSDSPDKGLKPSEGYRRSAVSPSSATKSMVVPGPIKLTYFGIEGVAEKVRLAFVLGGIEFQDERVPFDQWQTMKPTTKYGALPMMQVGNNPPVAQSGAMLRWAGQLGGLYPREQLLEIEGAIGLAEDLQRELMPSVYIGMRPHIYGYPEDLPAEERRAIQMRLREKLMESDGGLMRFLGYLQDFLGESRYMCGERVTIADCQIVPQLRQLAKGGLDGIPPTILDGFPKLKAYFDRFHTIDKVKAYYDKLAAAAAE